MQQASPCTATAPCQTWAGNTDAVASLPYCQLVSAWLGSKLQIVCTQGLIDVVQWLLQTPNVVEQKDGQRDTPLRLARRSGHAHIVQLLMGAGAKESSSAAVRQDLRPGKSCTVRCMMHKPVLVSC